MRIENTSKIPTPELRKLFTQVLKTAPMGKSRTWLQGKDGLYIVVNNAKYSRVRGRIYPSATEIYRKGNPIKVRGYIKLYIFAHTTIEELAKTFAHELSHFKDWYDHDFLFSRGNIPYGQEKRARAFADKVSNRLMRLEENNGKEEAKK